MDFTRDFIYDGMLYTVSYFESSGLTKFSPLSESRCKQMDFADGICSGFTVENGSAMNLKFTASVTATAAPIPEPETYTMMLAGLGLIGAVTRRRHNNLSV
jgi:hypothetical protein